MKNIPCPDVMDSITNCSGTDFMTENGMVTTRSTMVETSKWSSSMGFPSSVNSLRFNISSPTKISKCGSKSSTLPRSKNKARINGKTSTDFRQENDQPNPDKNAMKSPINSAIKKIDLKDLSKIGLRREVDRSPKTFAEKSDKVLKTNLKRKIATTHGPSMASRSSQQSHKRNIVSNESASQSGTLPSRQTNSMRSTKTSPSMTPASSGLEKPKKNHSDRLSRKQESTGKENELNTTAENVISKDPNNKEDDEVKNKNSEKSKSCLTKRTKSADSAKLPSTLNSSQVDIMPLQSSNKETPPSGHSNKVRRMSSFSGSLSGISRRTERSVNHNLNRNLSRRSLMSQSSPIKDDMKNSKILPEKLELFIDRCKHIEKTAKQNMKKVEQSHAAVTADIKKYRKQINNVLDVWEKEALERVDNIMAGDIVNLNNVLENCAKLVEEILSESDEITEYKTKLLEVNVIETEAKNIYREYNFINNDNISTLLKTESQIGEVKITHDVAGLYNNLKDFDKFVPTFLEEINVKADNETFDCDITGMAMVGTNRLVVADADNKSVKSIDTRLNKITAHLPLSSGPWDLTMVHRGQVAVTIPNEKLIQFVSIANGLVIDKHLKVNGECHGIAYSQERLIVGFRGANGRIQIIDMKGNILKTISKFMFKSNAYTFNWPDYIAVNKEDNSIYVSDWHKNTVTRLSWKGEVTAVYKDNLGTKIAGVAVASDGSVFLCKRTSHSIVKCNANLSVSSIILEAKHGLKYPWSLCFCDEEDKLYVDNNRNSNTVAVFELR